MASLARAIEDDTEVLLLAPHAEGFVSLAWLRGGEDLALWVPAAAWERMAGFLDAIGIDRVHFHHVHGLPREVLELPARLGARHVVTLHDYFPACPAYHMTGASGRYCGGDPACRRCLEAGPAQWPLSIDAWRARFAALLESANRVIAPSNDAADRIRAFFPGVSPVVWAHPEEEPRPARPTMRVLVPGAQSTAKGLDVLAACVRDARDRTLPLHFRVLGYVARPLGEWPQLPVSVSGEYREGDLESLVALEHGDAFFFPAQCPETWSYTLSAALASGLPIVASGLGALPERLAGRANARIVRWDCAPREMNDALLAFAPQDGVRAESPATSMAASRYRALYLEGLARATRRAAAWVEPDANWRIEPRGSPTLSSLAWLFDDAVRCGRGRSREELRRRVGEADARIAEAEVERAALGEMRAALERREAELRDAGEAAARAESEVRALRAALDRVESSRSWKLTAPLRAFARMLRGGR
jgi:glycosyltransferase involved in cell wall biosynthesis